MNTNTYFVYFLYDSSKNLLYVGKTNNIGRRFTQHFSKENIAKESWKKEVDFTKITLVVCENRCDLDIYETYFINKYTPRHNKEKVFSTKLSFELPYLEPTTYEEYISKKIQHTKNLISIADGIPRGTTELDSYHSLIEDLKRGGELNYITLINNKLCFNEKQLTKEWGGYLAKTDT